MRFCCLAVAQHSVSFLNTRITGKTRMQTKYIPRGIGPGDAFVCYELRCSRYDQLPTIVPLCEYVCSTTHSSCIYYRTPFRWQRGDGNHVLTKSLQRNERDWEENAGLGRKERPRDRLSQRLACALPLEQLILRRRDSVNLAVDFLYSKNDMQYTRTFAGASSCWSCSKW